MYKGRIIYYVLIYYLAVKFLVLYLKSICVSRHYESEDIYNYCVIVLRNDDFGSTYVY